MVFLKMEIKNAQQAVDQWIQNHGVRYFNELTNLAQLTEEVGEVARVISRRYGEQSEKDSDAQLDLGEELADVLFVVLCVLAFCLVSPGFYMCFMCCFLVFLCCFIVVCIIFLSCFSFSSFFFRFL